MLDGQPAETHKIVSIKRVGSKKIFFVKAEILVECLELRTDGIMKKKNVVSHLTDILETSTDSEEHQGFFQVNCQRHKNHRQIVLFSRRKERKTYSFCSNQKPLSENTI